VNIRLAVFEPVAAARLLRTIGLLLLLLIANGKTLAQSSCYAFFGPYDSTPWPSAAQSCNAGGNPNWDSSSECSGGFFCQNQYVLGPLQSGSLANNNAVYECYDAETTTGSSQLCGENPGTCGLHDTNYYYSQPDEAPISNCSPLYFVQAQVQQPEVCTNNCWQDPINPGQGNVYIRETDFKFAGASPIAFDRFYNSGDSSGFDNVPGWRHSYDQSITVVYQSPSELYPPPNIVVSPEYSTQSAACVQGFAAIKSAVPGWSGASANFSYGLCIITNSNGIQIATLPIYSWPIPPQPPTPSEYDLYRDDGQILRYTVQGGTITPPAGVSIQLSQTGSGFTVTDNDDNVETYNSAGVLQSITSRSGVVQTITYDSNGLFQSVADSFGNTLSVTRNVQGSIGSVSAGGNTVQYGYDGYLLLSSVINADNTTKSYLYTDPSFPTYLTGIIDENQIQYVTWGYNNAGQANSTTQPGGANSTNLTYNSDGSVTISDALGNVRNFTYLRVGDINRVTGISGSQCPTCQESAVTMYDNYGWVSSRTDYNGNLTCYANDETRGLEVVRVEGFAPGSSCPSNLPSYTPQAGTLQRKITTVWESAFREPHLVTEPNRTTLLVHDSYGNIQTKTVTDTSVTPNVSRTWSYSYFNNGLYGQVQTATGSRTDITTDVTNYTYYNCATGGKCGQVDTIENGLNQVTTVTSYNAYGQPLTITDPNGVQATLAYDAREHLKSRKVDNETTSFTYWPTGLLKRVILPDSSYTQYLYDNAHRLIHISDGAGNIVAYSLDGLGDRTLEDRYDPSNTLHFTHSTPFNTLGELYQDINAAGTAAVTTTYGYDSNGNQQTIAAPLGRNTKKYYDSLNRLDEITDPDNGNTIINYDANDNVASVQDPRSLQTSYTHDGFGGLTQVASPDTGTTVNAYDSAGNLSTATDSRQEVAAYSYDALNRMTQLSYADQTIMYTYDQGTYGKGHLTGASDAYHSMSWTYDAVGRVTGKGQTVGAVALSVGYGYANGDLVSLVTPSGQTLTYTYNSNHQITGITLNGSTTILSNATYEPFGQVNGWNWGNAATVTRTFNEDGLISQISATATGGNARTISYDDANRVEQIADTSGATWVYGYDLLDHLNSAASGGATHGWTYDANGNRTTETLNGPVISTYTISPTTNRIQSISGALTRSYTYDVAGHTKTYGSITANYNDRGRLHTLNNGSQTENLTYNALGQLVKVGGGVSGFVFYMYDEAGHLLGEYSSNGMFIEETIWLGDIPVAILQPNGSSSPNIYYIEADQVNTPRQITQSTNNAQVWSWFSDPFGTAAPTGTITYNPRFPGQIYDPQAGLNQSYFRDYDPAVGRYIESDLIGMKGGLNTYAYVMSDPISLIDSDGLFTQEQLTNIVYNETASLSGSGIDAARIDLAYVLQNRSNAGDDSGVAPDTLTNPAQAAINNGVPAALAAYISAQAAAARVINCPSNDPTGGARGFNLRGNDSTANRHGNPNNPLLVQLGPFNNSYPTIGNPNVTTLEQLPAIVWADYYRY